MIQTPNSSEPGLSTKLAKIANFSGNLLRIGGELAGKQRLAKAGSALTQIAPQLSSLGESQVQIGGSDSRPQGNQSAPRSSKQSRAQKATSTNSKRKRKGR